MSAFFFNKNHCTKIKCKVVYIWQLTIMLDLLDKHYKRKRFLGKNTFKAKMAQNMIINNIQSKNTSQAKKMNKNSI